MSIIDAILASELGGGGGATVTRAFPPNPVQPPTSGKPARVSSAGYLQTIKGGNLTAYNQGTDIRTAPSQQRVNEVLAMSNGNALVLFYDPTVTAGLKAMVMQVNQVAPNTAGASITSIGTPVMISTAHSSSSVSGAFGKTGFRLLEIDATHFLVTWSEATVIKCAILTVTGTSISMGSVTTVVTASNDLHWDSCTLSTNKIMYTYCNTSAFPSVVAVSFTTSTITVGTPVVLDGTNTAWFPSCCNVTTDGAFVTATATAAAINGQMQHWAITASGLVLTAGTKALVNTGTAMGQPLAFKIATGKVLVISSYNSAGTSVQLYPYSVSGLVLTPVVPTGGSIAIQLSGNVSSYMVVQSKSVGGYTTFIVSSADGSSPNVNHRNAPFCIKDDLTALASNSTMGFGQFGTISNGTSGGMREAQTIAYDPIGNNFLIVASYFSGNNTWTWPVVLHNTDPFNNPPVVGQVRNVFQGVASESGLPRPYIVSLNNGLWMSLQCSPASASSFAMRYQLYPSFAGNELSDAFIGMINAAGLTVLKGFVDGCNGLTVGQVYYYDATSNVLSVTSGSNTRVGFAISTTELWMKDSVI